MKAALCSKKPRAASFSSLNTAPRAGSHLSRRLFDPALIKALMFHFADAVTYSDNTNSSCPRISLFSGAALT